MPSIQQSGYQNEEERDTVTRHILELVHQTRQRLSRETLRDLFINLYEDNGTLCMPPLFSFDYTPFNEFDSHTFFEVAVQISESSLLQLGERYYQLHPGQLIIVPRNQVHRLGFEKESSRPATMLWMNITGDMTRSGYTIYDRENLNKIWGCDLIIPGGFIISEVLDEVLQTPIGSEQLDAIAIGIQFFLMQLERKLSFVDQATETSWNEQVANEIKHYIGNHLNSSLRLQELADVVSISACHLSKIFKHATDQTITGYIQRVKMEKAIEYLISGNLSISQIAFLLGYYDQYHFSKAFKTYTGYAPTTYRNAMSTERANGHLESNSVLS
ncbi:MAG: helix-turn-helix domain-containing protein [Clostridia bacterium]